MRSHWHTPSAGVLVQVQGGAGVSGTLSTTKGGGCQLQQRWTVAFQLTAWRFALEYGVRAATYNSKGVVEEAGDTTVL